MNETKKCMNLSMPSVNLNKAEIKKIYTYIILVEKLKLNGN